MSQQDDIDTVLKAMAKYDGAYVTDGDGLYHCDFCYALGWGSPKHTSTCPILLARRLAVERRPGPCPICERPNCEWHGRLDAKWKAALSD